MIAVLFVYAFTASFRFGNSPLKQPQTLLPGYGREPGLQRQQTKSQQLLLCTCENIICIHNIQNTSLCTCEKVIRHHFGM